MAIELAQTENTPATGVPRPKPIRVEARMPDGVMLRIDGYSAVQEGRFLKVITAIDEYELVALDVAVHVKVTGVLQSLTPTAAPAATTSPLGAAPPAASQHYVNPAMQALRDGTATRVPSASRISGTQDQPVRSVVEDEEGHKQVVDAGFV
jgi:hypothetical protein